MPAGAVSTAWDGRDEEGRIASDGNYLIASLVSDLVGNQAEDYAEVTSDATPPSVEATQSLFVFSPNGDGKFDTVDFLIKSNENSKIFLQVSRDQGSQGSSLNLEVSAEADREIKATLGKDEIVVSKRNNASGIWEAVSRQPLASNLADGTYHSFPPLSA